MSTYIYDPETGNYYDPIAGTYYDPRTQVSAWAGSFTHRMFLLTALLQRNSQLGPEDRPILGSTEAALFLSLSPLTCVREIHVLLAVC